MLTMLWCFPVLDMADKSCSEHIAGTMVHIRALSVDIDASGSFLGSLNGARKCDFRM